MNGFFHPCSHWTKTLSKGVDTKMITVLVFARDFLPQCVCGGGRDGGLVTWCDSLLVVNLTGSKITLGMNVWLFVRHFLHYSS